MKANYAKYFKMFKDILKDKGTDDYSKGAVYLFGAIIAYYLTLGILTAAGISKKVDIDIEKFKMIIDALEYAMTLFGGYVFGGKFIAAYTAIKGVGNKTTTNDNQQK